MLRRSGDNCQFPVVDWIVIFEVQMLMLMLVKLQRIIKLSPGCYMFVTTPMTTCYNQGTNNLHYNHGSTVTIIRFRISCDIRLGAEHLFHSTILSDILGFFFPVADGNPKSSIAFLFTVVMSASASLVTFSVFPFLFLIWF